MQPRDPHQVTPAPPSLPPPVLPPPIAKSPPVKPPPVKPPPVKPPPVKPPPVATPPPPPFFQPWPINGQGIFNVLQFGARADGRTDNTDAFRRALLTACAWGKARSAYARVVVPAGGLFQTFPVNLEGPCGAGLEVQIKGGIAGPANVAAYPKQRKSKINGGIAGPANVTSYPKPCKSNARGLLHKWRNRRASQRHLLPQAAQEQPIPTALSVPFFRCYLTQQINGGIAGPANVTSYPKPRKSNAWALRCPTSRSPSVFLCPLSPHQINGGIAGPANVTSYPKPRKSNAWALLFFREVPNLAVTGGGNPGKAHLKVYGSNGLLIERITTRSPFNSPNTDSIQLSKIENGVIRNSHLQGGDDNVAISDGCHNLLVENLVCINGHGVSIGSLGEDQDTGCVSDVLVRNVSFTGSNNALRIKTYQGGKGLVSNVTYKDIRVTDVTWPIIINQFYCDTSASKCGERKEAVAVTDISFINVKGTANGTHAILFNCSRSVPCTSLMLSIILLCHPTPSLMHVHHPTLSPPLPPSPLSPKCLLFSRSSTQPMASLQASSFPLPRCAAQIHLPHFINLPTPLASPSTPISPQVQGWASLTLKPWEGVRRFTSLTSLTHPPPFLSPSIPTSPQVKA
ncbi:unnamed protein product [Closterium sp. Naga37s-1]|nr:unnamed protein product [Closterium sp. Naga37s-1]